MVHYIDRRLNPKDKSLGNRQRFIKRARKYIKHVVDQSVRDRNIDSVDGDKKISIPIDNIYEPTFHEDAGTGSHKRVLTGNRRFLKGDRIRRRRAGAGSGRKGSDQGESEDEFYFVLSRDEFLDIFFEDLELPDLVKQNLKEIETHKSERAGYSMSGSTPNISVARTMLNSMGRRWALRRPSDKDFRDIQEEIFRLEKISSPTSAESKRLIELHAEIEEKIKRRRKIPYIDPLDVRFKYYEKKPSPNANAVMFCLMDVSASMGEREKDLAKRFFVLLHLFLRRRYEKLELVFIRHTQNAEEVDEETFFYSKRTGGTVVSSALVKMHKIIQERYPPSEWNIYGAQASDGENFRFDSSRCHAFMNTELMSLCQYFAYIEILEEEEAAILTSEDNGMELWRSYRQVASDWPNFAMKRISGPGDIYPVFRELFAKRESGRKAHARSA